MKEFAITIYSPEDGEEQLNGMSSDRGKRISTMALLMDAMEEGAWFRVERTS